MSLWRRNIRSWAPIVQWRNPNDLMAFRYRIKNWKIHCQFLKVLCYLWRRFWKLILFHDSPFNLCNWLVQFSIKTTFLSVLNIFTNWNCVLHMYSELLTCPNIQMSFNSEPTTTDRCKVKYSIYIYSELRNFPNVQVLLSNVASTIEFFDNRCIIFVQLNLTFRWYFYNFSNV